MCVCALSIFGEFANPNECDLCAESVEWRGDTGKPVLAHVTAFHLDCIYDLHAAASVPERTILVCIFDPVSSTDATFLLGKSTEISFAMEMMH